MEHNPYSPPTTSVADIRSDSAVADNREVLFACKLFWISFGLSLVSTASDIFRQAATMSLIGALVAGAIGAAVGFLITWWTVAKLKAGRNWMRLLVTIGSVLGYLSIPLLWKFYSTTVFQAYAGNPIKAAVSALQVIPGVWAIVLLNLPSSRAWFSQQRRA